jgi:hypothetical protein
MSKRLPYFQFEPAQYITKDIQFCSLASQGLFINICAIYWQRDCDLTIEQLKRRFNEQDLINELIKEKIISIDKDAIVISFLDSQYEVACGTKINRSKAGKKSAQLKKIRKEIEERLTFIASETGKDLAILIDEYQLNSTSVDFLLQQNSTIKIIEDNIKRNKENEIKKDEVFTNPTNFVLEIINNEHLIFEPLKMKHSKLKDLDLAIEQYSLSEMSKENPRDTAKTIYFALDKWLNSWSTNNFGKKKDEPHPDWTGGNTKSGITL